MVDHVVLHMVLHTGILQNLSDGSIKVGGIILLPQK